MVSLVEVARNKFSNWHSTYTNRLLSTLLPLRPALTLTLYLPSRSFCFNYLLLIKHEKISNKTTFYQRKHFRKNILHVILCIKHTYSFQQVLQSTICLYLNTVKSSTWPLQKLLAFEVVLDSGSYHYIA